MAERERFKPGDKVRVRTDHVPGHVRMPGYIRGKTGIVVGVSPAYPFPDAHAHGVKAEDEPTYDVRFNAEELWPNSADPAFVHVGVFQSYLERCVILSAQINRDPRPDQRQALFRAWSVFHFSTPATSSQEKACVFLRGLPSTQAKTRHCDWLVPSCLVSSRTSLATAAPTLASP